MPSLVNNSVNSAVSDSINSSPKSLMVSHIVSLLEQRITAGEYASDQWLPTERALAEEFRVSRPTIRQALVEMEQRGLVIRSAGSRPIVKRSFAPVSQESASRRLSLGLWLSGDPTDVGGAMTAQGINNVLNLDAYRLVVANHSGDTLEDLVKSERDALGRFARDRDIAGLILWYFGGSENLAALHSLRAANIPLVFVDRRPPVGFQADYVGVHNELAAHKVVEHLLDLGHRRIAHITNSELASSVVERLKGYRRALASHNVPYDPALVLQTHFMDHAAIKQTTEELAGRLLAMPDRPTAVFAVNDYTAQFIVAALRARGARVPEDISVAGFDDEERLKAGEPFLTTVRQPFQMMGEEAARLLLQRLDEEAAGACCHVLLDAPLVTRHSTRPPVL